VVFVFFVVGGGGGGGGGAFRNLNPRGPIHRSIRSQKADEDLTNIT